MTPDDVFKFLQGFADQYVEKWDRALGSQANGVSIKAQGWAILQAAHALRVVMQADVNKQSASGEKP
jgi:hypothetical protein